MRFYRRGRSYYVDYKVKKNRYRKSLGTNKKVAQLVFNDLELKIEKQQRLGVIECKKILFQDFSERYLIYSKTNKRESSYKRDTYSLRANLVPYFGGYYLMQVEPKMIEDYKSKRLRKVSPACLNRELSCCKNLFTKAIDWNYAVVNPVKQVKLLDEPPGRVRYLHRDEYLRLIAECPRPFIRAFTLVGCNSGMRKMPILSLKKECLDFDERQIFIKDSKNKSARVIPMASVVFDALRELSIASTSDYLFPNGNGGHIRYIDNSFRAAVKRAGIEDFTPHDMRHHFASWLSMQGWNLRTIQELLGLKTLRMVQRYAHLSQAHLREAIKSVDEVLNFGTNMAHPEKLALEV